MTAASNSEARKRAQEAASRTETALSRPIPAPVDSGAIGRLNDDECDRVLEAVWSWEEADEGVLAEEVVLPVVDAILREHTDRALAEAWDAALRHVWELNDPAYTVITDTESIHPILTRRDVEQAANENPYRAARQEQGR